MLKLFKFSIILVALVLITLTPFIETTVPQFRGRLDLEVQKGYSRGVTVAKPGSINIQHVFLTSEGFRVLGKIGIVEDPVKAVIIGEDGLTSLINGGKVLFKSNVGGKSLYSVVISRGMLDELTFKDSVDRVLIDKPFYSLLDDKSRLFKSTIEKHALNKQRLHVGDYVVSYLEIHDVMKVWSELGFTGEGVVVGLVDTGVDFAHPELLYDALARDEYGNPLLMVIDNGLTLFMDVTEVEDGYLKTEGLILPLYSPVDLSIYMVQLGFNLKVGGLTSLCGVYKVGLHDYFFIYFIDPFNAVFIEYPVLALLVDSQQPGVYDRVYFDLSTAFYDISVFMDKYVSWRSPDPGWFDYSVVDEEWFGPGKEIVARDFDDDGIPDFTIGTIVGYYLDTIGLINASFNLGGITYGPPGLHIGWDYSGKFIALTKDYYGHGTNVASTIVAKGRLKYGSTVTVKGVAPSAKLSTVESLWGYDTLVGLYWLSGYELEFTEIDGTYVLNFKPDGPRRADVVSNSWGLIYVNYILQNFPGSDVFSFIVDDILFTRNFVLGKPVSMVFAAGNEGPGYSSVSSPSSSLLAVSVGASTSFKFLETFGFRSGSFGDVVPFSSRGSTSLGYPKPDVLAVGAFDYAASRLLDNNGYGAWVSVFGGTSMATPIASGVLALMVQAHRVQHGSDPDVVELKLALKSGSLDVGYNVYAQGCGLINAYRSVEAVLTNETLVYVDKALYEAFRENYGNVYGELIDIYSQRLLDKAVYFNVLPGSRSYFELFIYGLNGINVEAFELKFHKELTVFRGVYSFNESLFIRLNPLSYVYSDYIEVVATLKNSTYGAGEFGYTPVDLNHIIDAMLVDWVDLDGDRVVDLNELTVLNWDARLGVQSVLTLREPDERVNGTLMLIITPWGKATPVELEVTVVAYRFVESNIVYPQSMVVDGESTRVNMAIDVSKTTPPGLREVKLLVTGEGGFRTVIPATVSIPLLINSYSALIIGGYTNGFKYDQFSMHAPYDLMSAWECKDWRILPIFINATDIPGLLVVANWNTGYSTDLSVLTLPPGGVFTDNGLLNVFASYKLPYDTGLVYNPNIRDQLNSKLRFYIPIQWPIPLRRVSIDILEVSHNDAPVILRQVAVTDRAVSNLGLYRLIYSFSSFSGLMNRGSLVFRILTIRSKMELKEVAYGDYTYVKASYTFTSPSYTPFYTSTIFAASNVSGLGVINGVESSIPLSILTFGYIDGLNVLPINAFNGFYINTSTCSVNLSGHIQYVVHNGNAHELNVIVVLNNYYWHSEGLFWFDSIEDKLVVISYAYPGLAAASFTQNVA